MKFPKMAALLAPLAVLLVGCSDANPVVDVPNKDRVPRKAFAEMTKEEKIQFINHTPMPRDAKDREIARIRAGG